MLHTTAQLVKLTETAVVAAAAAVIAAFQPAASLVHRVRPAGQESLATMANQALQVLKSLLRFR